MVIGWKLIEGAVGMDQESGTLEVADLIRRDLIAAEPVHPAVARLRNEVLAETAVEQGITRYDRMHHRHSRTPSRGM